MIFIFYKNNKMDDYNSYDDEYMYYDKLLNKSSPSSSKNKIKYTKKHIRIKSTTNNLTF
jgi:hypothetical protein